VFGQHAEPVTWELLASPSAEVLIVGQVYGASTGGEDHPRTVRVVFDEFKAVGRHGNVCSHARCLREPSTASLTLLSLTETTEQIVLDVGDRLVALMSAEIPIVISKMVPTERRALQSLSVKTVGIMRGLLDLTRHGHYTDMMILARSLADHVITVGWLAIDPPAHYPRWVRADAKDRLAAHERFAQSGRGALLEPEVKAMFELQKANQVRYPPDMNDRADKADECWAARLGFPAGERPFSDTYNVIFKYCSSRTHASVLGLNDVIESTPEHTVIVLDRGSIEHAGVLRSSLVIFGLGLKVAAETFSIPDGAKVDQLFGEYMSRTAIIDG
jgi:hypothetical protein